MQFQVNASLNLSKGRSFSPPAFTAGPAWRLRACGDAGPGTTAGEVLGGGQGGQEDVCGAALAAQADAGPPL